MHFIAFLSRILRAAFWLCLLFALDQPYFAALTLLAMLWHELFHILALLRLSKGARLEAHLCGLRLFPHGTLSYREERFVAAAGPIGGGIGALLCLALLPAAPRYFADFAICHLLTSLSNLLPIEGYDGYRILKTSLALRATCDADLPMRRISFLLSATLALFSLFIFGILGEGIFCSGAFLGALVCSLPEEKTFF